MKISKPESIFARRVFDESIAGVLEGVFQGGMLLRGPAPHYQHKVVM